jgi:3',5'-cyclic AMP phosphodiesterase CpdA
MIKLIKKLFYTALILVTVSCVKQEKSNLEDLRITFLSDVHMHNVYGDFQDNDYKGIENPRNGKFATIRTMQAQLHSTRLFNENYFAFRAALDDVVKRGIKLVVLPGDFSDDGQPVHVRCLRQILDEYSENYGIRFFAITGNHDPVRPYTISGGKRDFLGEGGKRQPIMSEDGMYASREKYEHPVVVSQDIRRMGYQEITGMLGDYGFFPQKDYLYWETPFSGYQVESYDFTQALEESDLEKRKYTIQPHDLQVPDVSYLVEPVRGLWLLAIDANVYIPKEKVSENAEDPMNFNRTGVGYNRVLSHKRHLIDWVRRVSQQAEELGKTLIVFSHYPMMEYNDDASDHINNLMGDGKSQSYRIPGEEVARIFADAGVKVHFGGHLHINDTGIRKTKSGNTLVNVQVPSLAAYIPAYKLLTLKNDHVLEIETIVIDSVPRFKELFDLYKMEHAYLTDNRVKGIWNDDILSAKDYHSYTTWHLKELVRLRFLPGDWPKEFKDFLLDRTGKELLILSHLDSNIAFDEIAGETGDLSITKYAESWQAAIRKAEAEMNKSGGSLDSFGDWTGFDLIFDFYRLRSADKLAINDIGTGRTQEYHFLIESFLKNQGKKDYGNDSLKERFNELSLIMQHFLNGAPADHFRVDLQNGKVESIVN